jgi:hypothetical protein
MLFPIVISVFRAALVVSLIAVAAAPGDGHAQSAAAPKPTEAAPAAPGSAEAVDELTPEVLYRILVGDVAMQRGDAALAARAYFEAAKDARDPVLARRATEVALFARQRTLALEAARLWQQLDPKADRARQMVASLAMASVGSDLKGELQRVLIEAAANDKSLGEAFLQLNQALRQRRALRELRPQLIGDQEIHDHDRAAEHQMEVARHPLRVMHRFVELIAHVYDAAGAAEPQHHERKGHREHRRVVPWQLPDPAEHACAAAQAACDFHRGHDGEHR